MNAYTLELLAIERANERETGEVKELTQSERNAIAAQLHAERDAINAMDAANAADNWFDLTHNAFN